MYSTKYSNNKQQDRLGLWASITREREWEW